VGVSLMRNIKIAACFSFFTHFKQNFLAHKAKYLLHSQAECLQTISRLVPNIT
jgi:hypothetical protein